MHAKGIHMRPGGPVQIQVSWPLLLGLGLVLLLLILGATAYFTVGANEEGVVTRFGRLVGKVPPGLHFKLPFGIDRVDRVKTAFTFKEEFGFRTDRTGRRTTYAPDRSEFLKEALMVTGDLNMARVEWIVQYRIKDAQAYLFHLRSPDGTLRDLAESVMREVVGDMTVTEVLTEKRVEINTQVRDRLQEALDSYDAGISVSQVILQDVTPPEPVKPAFDEVNNAQQQREKTINEARQEYNRAIPLAQGEALKEIQEAEGYALDRVNRAQGDVARFLAILEEYRKAPEVTRARLYLEAMSEILPGLEERVILDEKASQVLPLLDLGAAAKERRP